MTPELQKRLELAPSLPTLPSVALRIVEMGQQPEVDPAEVSRLIACDPALAARIMRAANSGFYAQRRRVENLRQAVMALGINAALTLALSFTLTRSLPAEGGAGLDYGRFWHRALVTGTASRCIGEALGRVNTEELMLAGLLQDLGMLALDAAMPERYGEIVARSSGHEALYLEERQALGTDHGEVGEWLMNRWQLPRYLAIGAPGAHDPESVPHEPDEAQHLRIMAASSVVADVWSAEESEAAGLEAAALCHQLFGWAPEDLADVTNTISSEAPALARLFEMEFDRERDLVAIADQAREALTLRNLQMIQEAADVHRRSRELEVQNRALREQAERDPLTELRNRRNLASKLEQEFEAATRNGWPLVIAFVDLDHFKHINDRYGHPVGDTVLYRVAGALRSQVRQGDILARYGGEEFLLGLPGIGPDAADRVLERLSGAVAGIAVERPDAPGAENSVSVTASVGYAAHTEAHRFASLDALIRAADEALYEAKREGRNRVIHWGAIA